MQLIGKTVGKYRIIEQIGQGGMATVYKAFQADLDRLVAIKILAPHHALSPEFRERFFREAKSIAKLSHPNILTVYDIGIDEDLSYIAMKYVGGSRMNDIMGEKIPLPRVCDLIDQISGALDHAHKNGIIHRDIKPANILLEGDWVFLTDFGIAKIMEASTALTSTGEVMGTPAYMSPEQASGKTADHRTDIYSLGIVLYELVTGQVPFTGETPYGVLFRIVQGDLPLPRSFRPDLSEEVERVILKALAKDPEHRYNRAGELAEALRLAVGKESGEISLKTQPLSSPDSEKIVQTPRPAASAPPLKEPVAITPPPSPVRNRRKLFAGIAALSVVLLIVIGLFYPRGTDTSKQKGSVESQDSSSVKTKAAPSLRIDSNPRSATVYVNGSSKGVTPILLDLPIGQYSVRVELPDYKPWEDVIRLDEPREYPVKVELEREVKTASLEISTTPPGAYIYINGELLDGKTPLKRFLKLGNYTILVRMTDYVDIERTIHIEELKEYSLALDLTKIELPKETGNKHDEHREDAAAFYLEAEKYLEQKNYRDALQNFARASEMGHLESLNELGFMYKQGLGVSKDLNKAASYFRKAAMGGYAPSQINLGIMYFKGQGVQKNDGEAAKWFRKAAENGDAEGQFYLATMYKYGLGVEKNAREAAKWFKEAADHGNAQAAEALRRTGK
jgi:serine/threonine protein kinase